ncbi:MAG: hypothetical protein HYW03_00360 [Deltaproteobacteria bacterium]|nr:hypothetical protein [Deltaproteobacteria bacterium]
MPVIVDVSQQKKMDRKILNLLSLIIGGSGVFVVLTKFNVPGLNMSFFGENPFAIKRDTIDNVMTWIFTGLALVGLLLQIFGEIWSDRFPGRQFTIRFYAWFSLASLLAIVAVVFVLTAIGNRIAKHTWLPVIVAKMTEAYARSHFIVEHDGWRPDQLNVKDTLWDPTSYRRTNFETAENRVAQIEKLLDLPSGGLDLKLRVERLRPYFEKG